MNGMATYPVRPVGAAAGVGVPRQRLLIIACGAIARELIDVARLHELEDVEVTALPAELHNRPERIPARVRERVRQAKGRFDRILVGYADCGTGGLLDQVCVEEGVERLPGAHCYELFAGRDAFAALHDAEPGTFYLTDYLARHANVLVFAGLGIDRHPELAPLYFGNYQRVVYLAQTDDPELDRRARETAERLGLDYERRVTGYGELGAALVDGARRPRLPVAPS